MQPTDVTTVVVSDAHLGAIPERHERAFRDFLTRVPDLGDELLVNGDLFDFWFEYRTVVLKEHFPTLRRLAELVDAGIRVRMVGGNHDAWAGRFLTGEVGVQWVHTPTVTEIGGRTAYLAHGDGLAGGDWGYRALKAVIRSRPAERAFRLVHPDLALWLIRRMSRTAEEVAGGPGSGGGRADVLAEHAAGLLRERPELDLVVFGHAHRPELREVTPGRHYLNAGDWIHHCSYAVVAGDEIELLRWAEGQTSGCAHSLRSGTS